MSSEDNKRRIVELFEAALREEPANRAEYLRCACEGDEDLLAEVASLVSAHEQMQVEDSWLTLTSGHRRLVAPDIKQIGRYTVVRELGRGGMGIVFEAHDPIIGRTVALKTILLDSQGTQAEQDMLQQHLFREARSAGTLSHPNIVTIFDSGVHEGIAYIAMEYVEGPTLRHHLSKADRLDRAEALDTLQQAAAALDFAHQSGVVHRDIKPSNIMLHRGALVKITDFGIAKIMRPDQVTLTGMPMGTPEYMSPEQILGGNVDGRSDQFSLAAVACEMLTGVKRFQADSVAGVVHQIVYATGLPEKIVSAGLPSATMDVLERALAKRDQERYVTCGEFVDALAQSFEAPSRSLVPRRWKWVPVLLLLLVLLSAGLFRAFLSRVAPDAPSGTRHAVLQRDFDKLPLRTEAYLDNRPDSPHPDDGSWRNVPGRVGGLPEILAIAAGYEHSLAVARDEGLWSWGQNGTGELAAGDAVDRATPVRVRAMPTFASVSAGGPSLALTIDGRLWAWGPNAGGEIGDGSGTDRWWPVEVLGLTDVVAMAAHNHSLAVTRDGSVWAWGENDHRQLGDGTKDDQWRPVRVQGLSDAIAVATGSIHSLAVKKDGTVWAWGSNENGRLGDGTTTDRPMPVRILGLKNIVAVASHAHHSLALSRDGTVWAWGQNRFGELGDGTATERWTPVKVAGLSQVVALAAGSQHSYALKKDGSVWAWGQNNYGALGDGTWRPKRTPVRVSGLSGVVAIAAGDQHAVARKSDGSVWTWGWNERGQLGREPVRDLVAGQSPSVRLDRVAQRVILQAGNSNTSQWAASLRFPAEDGMCRIKGAFQRAEPRGGRDTVDVAVLLDTNAAKALWTGHIDPWDNGRKEFSVRVAAFHGQALRFVVYSGPKAKDGFSDPIALEATIDR